MGGAIALRYMRLFNGFGVEQLVLLAAAAPSWTKRADFPYGLSRAYVDALIDQAATDRPQLARSFSHEQLFACPQSEAVKDWFEQIALSASGIATVQCAIALRDEDGEIYDIIAGPFFLCGAPPDSENFTSLTPEQMAHYEAQFHRIELYVRERDTR